MTDPICWGQLADELGFDTDWDEFLAWAARQRALPSPVFDPGDPVAAADVAFYRTARRS